MVDADNCRLSYLGVYDTMNNSSAAMQKLLGRAIPLVSAGLVATVDGTREPPTSRIQRVGVVGDDMMSTLLHLDLLRFSTFSHTTLMESSKAYEHDANDFDYYVRNPTAQDLPVLLDKFDNQDQEVWPWIWTHPNENGPHHVFVGKRINGDIVRRIQLLREESPQNNILILIEDDETSLEQAAASAGVHVDVFDRCHCGIVTGVNLELLNTEHKILMLDDERVVAFDYLTIC